MGYRVYIIMRVKKILLIGTIASSFYGFRAELIKALISNGFQVYSFTS